MASVKSRSQLSEHDYEALGREVESLLVTNYIDALHSTPRQIWNSLVRGIFAGLGGVLGATVGVALLAFVLLHLGGLPVVGHFFDSLGQSIRSGLKH